MVKENKLLEILKDGADVWNEWRATRTDDKAIDLKNADLNGVDLSGVKLDGADLSGANLIGANLGNALLKDAELRDTDLRKVVLNNANLCGANLSGANLTDASLKEANLADARLVYARLIFTDLTDASLIAADLMFAKFHDTVLANTNLTSVTGLEHSIHLGPSTLDHHTLQKSGSLPVNFLRGCGLPESLINHLPIMYIHSTGFHSSVICYSQADKAFARRLHDDLQGHGIRCWFDEKPTQPDEDRHEHVLQPINLNMKMLLVTSKDSLNSWWIDRKINSALLNEQQLKGKSTNNSGALITLNIDGHLSSGSCGGEIAVEIESRLAADFTQWATNSDRFDQALKKVVDALKISE